MKIVVTITDEGLKKGAVAITVDGEHTRWSRAKRVFDLIMPALQAEFRPVAKRERVQLREII